MTVEPVGTLAVGNNAPTDLVRRLRSSGYGFLPVQTLYSLADSGMTESEIISAAEGMRKAALASTKSAVLTGTARQAQLGSTAKLVSEQTRSFRAANPGASADVLGADVVASQQKQVRKQKQSSQSAWRYLWEDPVLQKHPSAALALKQYLSGALGPLPVKEQHLATIQQNLQVQGFGRDLQADGTWNPAWSAAQNQWKDHVYNSQLQGEKPGGLSVGHAMEALQALTPTSAWNALAGWVMALPDGARQLLGDIAGGTAQFGVDLYHLAPAGSEEGKTAGYDVNAAVDNALGGEATPKSTRKAFEENGGLRFLEDASNLIMVASVLGSAGRFGAAINEARGAALTADEAQRAGGVVAKSLSDTQRLPGTIAKSLSSQTGGPGIVPRAIVGGVLGGGTATLAGGSPTQVALATAGGAAVGGLSTTKAFQQIPLLGQTGPMIDSLADAEGLYYRVRNFIAPPNLISKVLPESLAGPATTAFRAADVGFQQSLLLGGEARGLAQLQDYVGGDKSTGFSKSVEDTHIMDTVNDAIAHRLGFTVLGQHIAPSLDDLMFVFSGRSAAALHAAPSESVGTVARALSDMGSDSLGDPAFLVAIQRAHADAKIFRRTPNLHTLINEAGGLENFNRHWTNAVADQASWWYAEQENMANLIAGRGEAFQALSDQNRGADLLAIKSRVRNSPDDLKAAVAGLRAQAGGEELANRLQRDITVNRARYTPGGRLKGFIEAQKYAGEHLLPWVETPVPSAVSTASEIGAPTAVFGERVREIALGSSERAAAGRYQAEFADIPEGRIRLFRGENPNLPKYFGEANPEAAGVSWTLHPDVARGFAVKRDFNAPELAGGRLFAVDVPEAKLRDVVDNIEGVKAEQARLAAGGEFQRSEALYGPPYELSKQGSEAEVVVPVSALGRAVPDPAARANFALLNSNARTGGTGLMRAENLDRFQANTQIGKIETEVADARAALASPEHRLALQAARRGQVLQTENVPSVAQLNRPIKDRIDAAERQIDDYLWENHGIRAGQGRNDTAYATVDEKIALARDRANDLAVPIAVHPDAPQAVKDHVQHLYDEGYKLVGGTDIGHALHGPANVQIMDGALSFQRRMAETLGFNPNLYPDANIATHRWWGMVSKVQDAVDKGVQGNLGAGIVLPPRTDATTILAYLKAEGVIDNSDKFKTVIRELFRTPQRVAKREGYYTDLEKLDVNKARDELNAALQLRDIPRKKVVDALTNGSLWAKYNPDSATLLREGDFANPALAVPPFSVEDANKIYNAIREGAATPGAYMLGASRLEDMFRASLGFAGKGLKNELGYRIANLPNKLITVRNELRFDLSPYFSFRRIAKINVKLAAEGVAPVWEPMKVMKARGTLRNDRDLLQKLMPQYFDRLAEEGADQGARILEAQDVFGLYNHRNYEAYAAGEWKKLGLSDDEIRAKLIRVFEYGKDGVAGRSGLERSTNFFFFPFSFDKTLYRNLGAYLLDKPAQRYLITAGIAAYHDFNEAMPDNPLATAWYDKHAPLLKEAERVNAFTHGLSLGQPGGINRDLLNVFLPQSWASNPANQGLLERFIPAIRDFQRVYQETQDQARIVNAARINLFSQKSPTYADPEKSTLNANAQLEAAFAMQLDWETAYKSYIDQNSSTRNPDEKVRFPLEPVWGKFGGEPITKANIRKIVALRYPAYSPEGAIVHVTQGQAAYEDYLLDLKGKPLHQVAVNFGESAQSFARYVSEGKYTPAEQARITEQLRAQAAYLAERDTRFYALYGSNFQRSLGPLEAVTK